MKKVLSMAVLLLASAVGPIACNSGNDDDENSIDDKDTDVSDAKDPAVALKGLAAFDVLAGNAEIEVDATDDVAVAKVELIAAGKAVASANAAPFTLSWDTSKTADGIVEIMARVTDSAAKTADSAKLTVVVANTGKEIELVEGSTGTAEIPSTYKEGDEIHIKHHWSEMKDSFTRVVGVLEWEQPKEGKLWKFELQMGQGECPHSGVKYGTPQESDKSPFVYEVQHEFASADFHFFHIAPMNPMDQIGKKMPYTVRIFGFK